MNSRAARSERGSTDDRLGRRAACDDPTRTSRALVVILLLLAGGCGPKMDPELAALPPDERIQVEIVRALRADPDIDDEAIRVEVLDGRVVVSGVVSSYQESRDVLRIVADVDGVVQVINRLRVIPYRGTAASRPGPGSGPP